MCIRDRTTAAADGTTADADGGAVTCIFGTCADANGAATAGADAVSDTNCGAGVEATAGATGDCAGATCDISGTPADKTACCTACDGTTEFATEATACTAFTDCDQAGQGGTLSSTADLSCSACAAGQYAATSDNECITISPINLTHTRPATT